MNDNHQDALIVIADLASKLGKAEAALEQIAMPKRSDGTYNRSREACEQLARETLEKIRNNA